MAGEWQEVSLDDVADEITVGYVGSMASEYTSGGVPFLRSLNVERLRINKNDLKYITPEFHQRIQKSKLQPGDVVIVRTGKPGTCSVVPQWLENANCSDLVIVRCGEQINNRFLAYYMNSAAAAHVSAHLVGAVQQHFNVGAAKALRLKLPPLNEQRAMVHILGTLDEKIELNRRRNQTLEAMARALFKDWFVDFGPVRAKMEGREPYLPADLWKLFPDRLDDEGKPEGWGMAPIDAIAPLETSSISPGKSPGTIFEHYSIPAFDEKRMPTLELGASIKSNKYRVHADAVLVSKLNPQTPRVWMPSVATHHAVCSTEFMQFVPRRTDDRPFLYCLMVSKFMEEEVLKHVTGSTGSRQRAQPSQIAKVKVLLPRSDILSVFNNGVEPLLHAVADNQRESCTLAQLRDTLLPKLISGELRIKNAERFMEGAERQAPSQTGRMS